MNSKQIIAILKKDGGYITNSHIILTSGKHTDAYINKDAIYPHTKDIAKICLEIAKKFKNKNIEAVAAPALGGIILSQWVAYHLSCLTKKTVLGIYTEKTPDRNQILTRGYDKLIKGKRTLIVEDVTTTGGSVQKVIASVKANNGKPVAVAVIANRDPINITSKLFGMPFFALTNVIMQAWDEKDCMLCKKGIPINTTIGSGKVLSLKR